MKYFFPFLPLDAGSQLIICQLRDFSLLETEATLALSDVSKSVSKAFALSSAQAKNGSRLVGVTSDNGLWDTALTGISVYKPVIDLLYDIKWKVGQIFALFRSIGPYPLAVISSISHASSHVIRNSLDLTNKR